MCTKLPSFKIHPDCFNNSVAFCNSFLIKPDPSVSGTLNSVLNQTYNNLEVIIIYDDPKKADLDYIKELASLDQRVKLTINDNRLYTYR